jgi:hypothetical protein
MWFKSRNIPLYFPPPTLLSFSPFIYSSLHFLYNDTKQDMKGSVRKREQGKRKQSGEEEEKVNLLEAENALFVVPSPSPLSPSHMDTLLEGVVFSSALSVYLYTAYPSLSGGKISYFY